MTWRWFAAALATAVAVAALAVHDCLRVLERALTLPDPDDDVVEREVTTWLH